MMGRLSVETIEFLVRAELPREEPDQQIQSTNRSEIENQYEKAQVHSNTSSTQVPEFEGSQGYSQAVQNSRQDRPKQQPVTVEQKIGRNDPCPCGSGKKYKQCHGS